MTVRRSGLRLALLTAAAFGLSGTFASALLEAGWSSGAAVMARVGLATLVLTYPAVRQLRAARVRLDRHAIGALVVFGLVAVALCQFAYFAALERLSVGVALMLEYLGIVLVVLWQWLRTRVPPRRLTVGGSAVAMAGLALVLDLAGQRQLDPVGVLWGLVAAAALAAFFVISAKTEDALPPVAMAWGGVGIGAVGLGLAGLVGLLPVHATFGSVQLGGLTTQWWVAVVLLALVSTVLSYSTGIAAARRLGATVASFVGLTEVLFAVLFAWLLLRQLPTLNQLLGGLLILTGVTAVRVDELRTEGVAAEVPDPLPGALSDPLPGALSDLSPARP